MDEPRPFNPTLDAVLRIKAMLAAEPSDRLARTWLFFGGLILLGGGAWWQVWPIAIAGGVLLGLSYGHDADRRFLEGYATGLIAGDEVAATALGVSHRGRDGRLPEEPDEADDGAAARGAGEDQRAGLVRGPRPTATIDGVIGSTPRRGRPARHPITPDSGDPTPRPDTARPAQFALPTALDDSGGDLAIPAPGTRPGA